MRVPLVAFASALLACTSVQSVEPLPIDSSTEEIGDARFDVTDETLGDVPVDVPGDAGVCPKPKVPAPPGPRVTSRDVMGTGACTGRTLGSVIDAIHAAHPELSDITAVYAPGGMGDGSFVYAFAVPDGFALVLKRGGGDCPAGCTENEYWYFETDSTCGVRQLGHYHPSAAYSGPPCTTVDGAPMWGLPPPPDPAGVCGADLSAKDISGTYSLCADGTRTACTAKAGAEPIVSLPSALTLVVAQSKTDLAKGTVTITGTGHSLVDGIPLDATFVRRRLKAAKTHSNLPSTCPDEYNLSIELDFEGILVPGGLSFFELHTLDCAKDPSNYCKGELHASLVVR